jgi:hypothetical protein
MILRTILFYHIVMKVNHGYKLRIFGVEEFSSAMQFLTGVIAIHAVAVKDAPPLAVPRATRTTPTVQQVASTLVVKFHQPLQPQ